MISLYLRYLDNLTIFLVKVPGKLDRLIIYLRAINKNVIISNQKITGIQELFSNIKSSAVMSTFNIKRSFNFLALTERMKQLFEFTSNYMTYRMKSLFFGISC